MLEIEDVHNYYPGEEDLRFPIITALRPQDFQTIYISFKSNNWKKMHHIPLKATSINGYKIFKWKQEYCSSRSRKKQKKFMRKHFFTPNWEDILKEIKQ